MYTIAHITTYNNLVSLDYAFLTVIHLVSFQNATYLLAHLQAYFKHTLFTLL